MDSTQVASNILKMSRLQLLVEAVQRMHRNLSEVDQKQHAETFAPYLEVCWLLRSSVLIIESQMS
jgi:hypothetical protein